MCLEYSYWAVDQKQLSPPAVYHLIRNSRHSPIGDNHISPGTLCLTLCLASRCIGLWSRFAARTLLPTSTTRQLQEDRRGQIYEIYVWLHTKMNFSRLTSATGAAPPIIEAPTQPQGRVSHSPVMSATGADPSSSIPPRSSRRPEAAMKAALIPNPPCVHRYGRVRGTSACAGTKGADHLGN